MVPGLTSTIYRQVAHGRNVRLCGLTERLLGAAGRARGPFATFFVVGALYRMSQLIRRMSRAGMNSVCTATTIASFTADPAQFRDEAAAMDAIRQAAKAIFPSWAFTALFSINGASVGARCAGGVRGFCLRFQPDPHAQ
ncbi:hypothetical protein [Candidatus Amarolinea aalborgensis]|uniref:hypothetical protein n=1 Tax=Candidatus Amarolinea aalborgensis TaxID=2249329 RepID=UPI003BFA0EAE